MIRDYSFTNLSFEIETCSSSPRRDFEKRGSRLSRDWRLILRTTSLLDVTNLVLGRSQTICGKNQANNLNQHHSL